MIQYMPAGLMPLAEQPAQTDIKIADDLFVKQIVIHRAGSYVPQHAHTWDHLSMLALGSVRVWEGGVCAGDFAAPSGILIKAGVKHTFLTLEDNTIIYCIHNISRTGEIEVAAEHRFEGIE